MLKYFLEFGITFLVLLGLWCTLLYPTVQLDTQSDHTTFEMKIENVKQAFEKASLYTGLCLTVLRFLPRTYKLVVTDRYPWIYAVAYMLDTVYFYGHSYYRLMIVFPLPYLLQSESFQETHKYMALLFTLQYLSAVGVNSMLWYILHCQHRPGRRWRLFC